VESRPNPGHRRSVLITATARGQVLNARIRRAELTQLAEHTAVDCTDAELRTAAKVLAALSRDVRDRAQALRANSGALTKS